MHRCCVYAIKCVLTESSVYVGTHGKIIMSLFLRVLTVASLSVCSMG